ncbi:MAG: hypothetical protein QFB86_01820 [Patescibacteria group bacterium]|nr:hypothetical protein [Patescibacteria group bacterium]
MKQLQNIALALSVLALALVAPGSVAVFAEGGISGSSGSGSGTSGSSTSGSGGSSTDISGSGSTSGGGSTSGSTSGGGEMHTSGSGGGSAPRVRTAEPKTGEAPENQVEAENETTQPEDSKEELHKKGEELIAKMRKEHGDKTEKSADQKEKLCESHKQGLEHKFKAMETNSQRTHDRIAAILDKGLAFKSANKIEDTNLEALIATATKAEKVTQVSIDTLKAENPTMDCNNVSVASDVASFKLAAEATRSDIRAFRTDVKNVLTALETAKPVEDSTAEGSAQ